MVLCWWEEGGRIVQKKNCRKELIPYGDLYMKIAVIVPSYHEEGFLNQCLDSIEWAKTLCPCEVEVHVARDIKGIGRARNIGAANTSGEILVFLDADCTMSRDFLLNVYELAENWENVGGGVKWVHLDRYSLGTILSLVPVAIKLYWNQITIGAFWVRREVFEKIGGFDDSTVHELDYDFAKRLRKQAMEWGRKFRSIKKAYIVWSTRGHKKYGEWYWLKGYKEFRSEI